MGGAGDPRPAGKPFPLMGLVPCHHLRVRHAGPEGDRSVRFSLGASSDTLSPHSYLFCLLCPWEGNDSGGAPESSVGLWVGNPAVLRPCEWN